MSDFTEIQKKLLEPFPEEVIRQRDGLDYVEPYYYFMRWQECFPQGFRFECNVNDFNGLGGKAMVGHAGFYVTVDKTEYGIVVPVVEPYQIGRSSGEVQRADQSANKFTSAGCKNISRCIGLGLHLYKKQDEPEQKPSQRAGGVPRSSASLGAAVARVQEAAVTSKVAPNSTGGGSAALPPEQPDENPVEKGKAYAFLADLRRSTGTSDTLYAELLKELFPGKSSPRTGKVSEGDLTIAQLREAAKELKRRTNGK